MANQAYALTENAPEGLDAAVACGDGQSLHVTKVIEENNGIYVTDSPQEQEVLDSFKYAKRVSLEDAEMAHKRTRAAGASKSQAAGDKNED